MWLPQGVKGQPGEKVSPHFPLCPSARADASTPWTRGLSEAPAQPSRWHARGAELPAGPVGPQPLTPFPNSFHTSGWGLGIPGLSPKPPGEWVPAHPPAPPPGPPAEAACACAWSSDSGPRAVTLPRGKEHSPCFEWDAASCPLPAGTAWVLLSEHHHLSSHLLHTPSSSFCCPPHHTEPLCVTLNPELGSSRQLGLRLRCWAHTASVCGVPTLCFSSSVRGQAAVHRLQGGQPHGYLGMGVRKKTWGLETWVGLGQVGECPE